MPLTLAPGETLVLFDEAGGESAFTARFGRNLPGPERHYGSFSVAPADEVKAAKGVRAVRGKGPSLTAKLKKMQAGVRRSAAQELDDSDNYADFSFWSKKNTLDLSVTAPPVEGAVGKTVEVAYEIVNNGPSDESLFPTVHSGYGRLRASVRVKIKATPGTDGTIVAGSIGVASTESAPANNTAAIVLTTAGGQGGGLPVTGASTSLVAGTGAAVAALGVGLFLMARRRRLVLVAPND